MARVSAQVADRQLDESVETTTGACRHVDSALMVLVALYATSQIAFRLLGIRIDASPLDGRSIDSLWQLLDVHLLRHQLLTSLWNLHSQPPLFNLAMGLLAKLPHPLQGPVELAISVFLGLAMVVVTYFLCRELGIPRLVATVAVALFIVASPEYALFQNWLSWSYPTALAVVTSAWLLVRYLRTGNWLPGLGFFSSCAFLVLIDSTYQWIWMVVVVLVVLYALRSRWRQVLALASLPLLTVGFWYAKDAALFGTTTTSSWLGMNLAKMVLVTAPPGMLHRLQAEGVLSPLATINPFSEESAYLPTYGELPHTGVAVLDQLRKSDGALNFNNLLYISVSNHYLHQDTAFIEAEPGRYAYDVAMAVQVWQTPGDQYFPPQGNAARLQAYSDVYDRFVLLQPLPDPATPVYPLVRHQPPPADRLSYMLMAMLALALLGAPALAICLRKTDREASFALAVMWLTLGYSFVITSLLEVGENERFRFELGPLPLLLALMVLVAGFRAVRRRPQQPVGPCAHEEIAPQSSQRAERPLPGGPA